jgi:uncharacterized membrane protein
MHTDKPENKRKDANLYRLASFVGGLLLIGNGLKKGSLIRTAVGGYLAYKGVAGDRSFEELSKDLEKLGSGSNVNIRTSLVINRPRHQVYTAWRRLSNIPLFMKHINKVEEQGIYHSEWEMHMPANLGKLQWKAKVVKEVEDELLAWQSEPGSEIENAGKVQFRDALGKQGTAVDVVFSYHAPMGIAGEKIARLFSPLFRKMIREDIRGFKDFIELDEIQAPGNLPNDMQAQPAFTAIP